jgi:hypothetical protein
MRLSLGERLRGWEMGRTRSRSCLFLGFGISGVSTSLFIIRF